jgi:hypothetical protein
MNTTRYRIDPRVSVALIEAARPGYFERVDRLTRRSLAALPLAEAVEALDWYAYRHGADATIALASTDRRVGVRDEVWRWTDGGPQRALAARHDLLDAYAAGDVEAVRALAGSAHGTEVLEAVDSVLASALGARDEMAAALLVVKAAHDHHTAMFETLLAGVTDAYTALPADHFRRVVDSPARWWHSPVKLRGSRLAGDLAALRGRRRTEAISNDAALVCVVHGTLSPEQVSVQFEQMFSREAGLFAFMHADRRLLAEWPVLFSMCGGERMLHAALEAGYDPNEMIARFILVADSPWALGTAFVNGFASSRRDAWFAATMLLPVAAMEQYDDVFGVVMEIARSRGLDLGTVATLMDGWHGTVGELFAAAAALA